MLGRDRTTSAFTPLIRAAVAILGVAAFVAGAVAVFVTENGTGAAALVAIGAAFMLTAVLGDRVQSFELSGVKLTIRDLARDADALALEAERRGDDEAAARLRTVARELEALARSYRRLRGSMRSGQERTRALEHVMNEARRLARDADLEPGDVATWFEDGAPEARITALGVMQGNPQLRDFEAALDAISDPRSAFEQYHGLRLAEMMLGDLSPTQRAELVVVTERALRSSRVRRDSDRRTTGERLLTALRDA